jgi:ribosome-associated toxin RatA of RatAB toxin-antitoxin module
MYTAEASAIVQANPSTTWAYVSNYQNFDKFMSNVNEVKMLDSQQSEWHMSGPLGIPVSWKAVTTETTAPSRLAWKSTEGALENDGFISITPDGTGSRVTVHINYNPPLGAIGEFVATLFKDPQAMLEHDLTQLDALISNGDAGSTANTVNAGSSGGMDGYERIAERGEKVAALIVTPVPGGMTGYAVAERESRPDMDGPDMDSTDPNTASPSVSNMPNNQRDLAEKTR